MKRFGILIAAVLLGGCATSGDVERLRSQIAELQTELAAVRRTAAPREEIQNVNQRIAEQTEQLLRSNATLVAKVDQIEERVQNTQGQIEQTNYRMDRLAQQMTTIQRDLDALKAQTVAANPTAAPPVGEVTVTPPITPATPTEDPSEMYGAALRDYQRGNYELAISGFRDFLQKFPSMDLSDNAAYWIGESLYSQKKYPEAIQQFDAVVTQFPRSDKVPASLLKKGLAYITLGERAQGIVQLQYVVHEHPATQEAGVARNRLRLLGIETR